MFHLTWFSPYKGEVQTLRFHKDPSYPLGIRTDVDGVQWDVHGIIGKHILCRRVYDAPEYYSTATYASQNGSHEWIPYLWELER